MAEQPDRHPAAPPWATAESGSSSTSIECASLPAVDLTGASVWVIAVARWEAWTSRIASSSEGTIGFTNNGYPDVASRPGANFYVFGTLPLLDAENEWGSAGQNLYLWVPSGGDPSAHVVEAKARNFGIDLSGKQHVELRGIGILGCTIKTDGSTANIVIDRMNAQYVGHWEATNDNFNPPANRKGGIQINGTNIVIRNSTLAYGAGGVLSLEGSRNQIVNSLIQDSGYSGLNAECLGLFGTELLASHNTVHISGRSVIGMGTSRSLIAYNHVSRASLITWDVGVFMTGATVLSSPAAPIQIRFSRLSPAPVDYIVEGSGNIATWAPIATLLKGQDSWSGPATVSEPGAGSSRPVRVSDPTAGGRSRSFD